MPDARELLAHVPRRTFSGTVYRVCVGRYRGQTLSVRGSLLHEGRYNIRGLFGALYTSLAAETAQREIARYFTVPPKDGLVLATIDLRLSTVADLSATQLDELTCREHGFCQALGQVAWETGIEGLLVPSAAVPHHNNLAVFVDNQEPGWMIRLRSIS